MTTLVVSLIRGGWAVDFAHDVVPVLNQHCAACHAGSEANGGFNFNTRRSALESGMIEIGDADASYLIELVRSDDPDIRMPPEGKRPSESEIAILQQWINEGLPWQPGFRFGGESYVPPLRPREVELPSDVDPNDASPKIDALVRKYWRQNDLQPNPVASDQIFIRRVYLDLIGILPTADAVADFVAEQNPDKDARLVDDLLRRRVDFAEHWLTFFNDLFRNDYSGTGFITKGRTQISQWLYDSLVAEKPFDQMAAELIAPPSSDSAGFANGIRWRGNVSAAQAVEMQFSQSVSQALLGINMKCASCHDSFIDQWTLEDAYALAAVVADQPLAIHRCDQATGKTAVASWPFPELGDIDADAETEQRRSQLAALVTHPDNGRFSRTIVNRLWGRMMGRGLVDPLDAMHTPPWDADVLEQLSNDFIANHFDLKATLRQIALSDVYRRRCETIAPQRAAEAVTAETPFHGVRMKRMTAEQFVDAVWQITSSHPSRHDSAVVRGELPLYRPVRASLMVADSLMRSLGRPGREQIVTSRPDGLTMLEALDLSAGETLSSYLAAGAEAIHRQGSSPTEIVEQLYRSALCRSPNERELQLGIEMVRSPDDADQADPGGLEDFLWCVCMLPEFWMVQ